MRAILASIQPYWYYLIAIAKIKDIEIRKTKPKHLGDTYFYVSNDKKSLNRVPIEHREQVRALMGTVPAKFTLKEVDVVECSSDAHNAYSKAACLTQDDFINYCNGQDLYAWHITDLVVFNKPMELGEFYRRTKCIFDDRGYCQYDYSDCGDDIPDCCKIQIIRPPQSWQYVEVQND